MAKLEIFEDMEQGSPEWIKVRLGIPTASCFSDVLAKGQGKVRRSLLYKLAGERVTGAQAESYSNGFMDRGKRQEPEARALYSLMRDGNVKTIGFARRGRIGASPDALVDEDGGLEVKSASASVMLEVLERGPDRPPTEHIQQCQGNMFVLGRSWWDLMIYHPSPRFRPPIFRIYRDPACCAELAKGLEAFNREMDELIARNAPETT